jgi:hypothetical protein
VTGVQTCALPIYKEIKATHPRSSKTSTYKDPRDVETASRYGHKYGYTGD